MAGNSTPDFGAVSAFCNDHLAALSDLFHRVLALCQRAKLVNTGHLGLEGTDAGANAFKHQAMSYQRM